MSPNYPKKIQPSQATDVISRDIDAVLSGIRVPELPYPVGRGSPEQMTDWRPLLLSCWEQQRDESVTHVMQSVSLAWTVRQVNAAYLADRFMDVFLRTSGLHEALIRRVARLRFFLAWRMGSDSSAAFEGSIRHWLDGLVDWQGWSDSGGRSSRALLDQLDALVHAVRKSFEANDIQAFDDFASQWASEAQQRHQKSEKLHQRLMDTERGAARQRRAEQTARACVGRALGNRKLPEGINVFIFDYWLPLLRQIAWNDGPEGEDWRHAAKLLEWLVWIGDPALSDKDRDRLYQVGEQIGDRITDVWNRVQGQTLPLAALKDVERVMMARLRGEIPERIAAISAERPLDYDPRWLSPVMVDAQALEQAKGTWFVEGEGATEHRRYFLDFLNDSRDVLWTNGFGVKLALTPWHEFLIAQQQGTLKPLPPLNSFGTVLADTVEALARVLEVQRRQRDKAAAEASAKAELLRQEKEAAEQKRAQDEADRFAEEARVKGEQDARRLADEEAETKRVLQERMALAASQVGSIKLGGWIALDSEAQDEKDGASSIIRLKLAVRINASRKLVFVDRLGLNRTEYTIDDLVHRVAKGEIRVLSSAAEFDDTLSRVVGRIRVGRT
ncbi:MAG: DUF1631 family protein [Marinobacter sp.]|uniref:DUF1631 family protein n=1 Tax=Marinobacter sp. TaxID=50741 RepID=UPI0034A068E8